MELEAVSLELTMTAVQWFLDGDPSATLHKVWSEQTVNWSDKPWLTLHYFPNPRISLFRESSV